MEQSTQSSGQQQNRQQPVYDIRNGGHYGMFIPNFAIRVPWFVLTQSLQAPAQL